MSYILPIKYTIKRIYRQPYIVIFESLKPAGMLQGTATILVALGHCHRHNVTKQVTGTHGNQKLKYKGLADFFYSGSTKSINAKHATKLETRLDRLDAATGAEDMRLPGYRLHQLEPKMAGRWAIDVFGAWRMTFEFDDEGNAFVVDYEQYH